MDLISGVTYNPKRVSQREINGIDNRLVWLGIPFVEPKPLLRTVGRHWKYQSSASLEKTLMEEMSLHFNNLLAGRVDKLKVPTHFILSRPGTGKSRNGTEFAVVMKRVAANSGNTQGRQ